MQQLVEKINVVSNSVSIGHWLHDVEHITCDSKSGVYWKGRLIDFIKDPEQTLYQEYVHNLAIRCQHLESIKVPVNVETVVHFGDWFVMMEDDYKYKRLLMSCPDIRVSADLKIIFISGKHIAEFTGSDWQYYSKDQDQSDSEWSDSWDHNALVKKGYKDLPLSYSDLDGLNNFLEYFNVPVNLFD